MPLQSPLAEAPRVGCEPEQLARAAASILRFNSEDVAAGLLLVEVDALVLMAGDGRANLGRGLAQLSSAGRRKSPLWRRWSTRCRAPLVATAQAGVAQGAVATAVAGKLIDHAADLGCQLVDVDLPGIAEVFSCQLGAGENRRQGADLERRRGMIGGNIVGRVGPLRIAGRGDGENRTDREPNGASSVVS